MANEHGEPFVLDFPNGQRVEDILKKAEANYSKAEIDMKMSSKANAVDVYNKTEVDIALRSKVDKVSGKGLSTNDYTTADKEKLAGIETQANKTVVDDTLDNTSTNPVQNKVVKAALDNKADTADIPTVPITAIQKNGTGITPVSGTVNITVPTQASDINAATATQGDKADTAIQGIKVNSSTVNPDVNKVVNITVPTTAADVSALPDTTKYAAALSLTINSSTYVITGQLKDQNGDNLGTAQTIDLPLESVVVGGSYNSQTKKVVLTLQNGNTIEFSVADLVSGLQTEFSASNKLNPAYIDYDSTHRAVSDTEKSTWNNKQNALSSTQLDAVNSGIDSTKVEQIETNENNISWLVDTGVKNLLDYGKIKTFNSRFTWSGNTGTYNGVTIKIESKAVKISASNASTIVHIYVSPETDTWKNGNTYRLTGVPQASADNVNLNIQSGSPNYSTYYTKISNQEVTFPNVDTRIRFSIESGATFSEVTIPLMMCSVAAYSASPAYQPYALSNAELTTKEQVNENNISLKANTTDVNAATANLQSQINQIAQAAGTGTADTEIGQARVGADGTSYQTLKGRLDAEYGALTDEQTDLNELIGKKHVSFIATSGYIGSNPDGSPKIVSSEQFEISEPIRVLKGEIIRFNAVGYSTAVVMICECTAGGSLQRVLVKSTDSTLTTYTYTAEWDMYIKVSYDKRKTHTLDILTEKSNDFMSNYINTKAFGSSGLNITSSSFNLDNCEPNKIYAISAKCTNVPSIENGGICFTTARYNNSIDTYAQTFIGLGGNLYTRFKAYGGTWTEWKTAVNALVGSETNINDSTFDLDDCSPNKIYLISQQCVHAPAIGICYILAHKSNAVDTYCQLFVTTSGICYTRFKAYGGTWTEWKRHSNDSINTFAKLSLFDTVGVVGDSYASGEIYATDGTLIGDKYKISWIQQLARRNGFTAHNFSVGGLSTRTWLTSTQGLSKLNSTEACDLYILALGINDFYSIGINYIGNESDMASATADTFYGNYAKIINAIKAKAPNSKLMIANIAIRITADASNKTVIKAFNEAIVNISEYFEIPLIDQCNYEYFQSAEYQNNMYHGHPTAVGYSAMATALENCISMSMIENKAYFENADFN